MVANNQNIQSLRSERLKTLYSNLDQLKNGAYFLVSYKKVQGDSRVYQLMNLVGAIGVGINASYQEAKTAKEPGRTKFAEMLSLIERGKANGIISWHPDRLARNTLSSIINFISRINS